MTDIITINSKGLVPNHLNDTNIFCRYSNNSIIEIEPKELHFSGYNINERNYQDIKFTNISDEICRFHIIPPVSKYFRLQYKKPERMVPGFSVLCTVIFSPDKVRNYNDFIKIHTKDSENNIVVPLYAYPAIKGLVVPRNIKFPITAVGKISKRQICLHSDSEMDFDFEIVVTKDSPSIKVDPLHGVIPGRGDIIISLQFCPTAYITCEKTINIYVNQYNFKPIICSLFGTAQPGLDRKQVIDSLENEAINNSNMLSIIKLESKRRSLCQPSIAAAKSDKSVDKALDPNISKKQLKTDFEARLLENVNNERQNQLRWQTCRGHIPLKDEEVEGIKKNRTRAFKDYQLQIRDQNTLSELYLNNTLSNDNWKKTFSLESDNDNINGNIITPQFVPECWTVRKFALDRFRSAVWRQIINTRLSKRLEMLKKSGGDYQEKDSGHMHPGGYNLTFVREHHAISDERIPKQKFIFDNHFNMSEYKLTLPLQPQYNFENLIVPLQMHVLGYERMDNTALSYIPQKPPFPFKSAPVVDATSTMNDESQVEPPIFSTKPYSAIVTHEDRDRTSKLFWPSCSYYDKHAYFPLYYYKNELLEPKDPIEMEWKIPKSPFLVCKKSIKSTTSDNLIVNSLDSCLLPIKVPTLLCEEDLKNLDYQPDNCTSRSITRAVMLEEFPILESLKKEFMKKYV